MNLIKKAALYCGLILPIIGTKTATAQCPSSVSLNVKTNTAASCPSSGIISFGSNAPVGALQYVLTSGPAGSPLHMPQGDSTFTALPAGSYTAVGYCNSNSAISDTIQFTIANGYTPLSNIATTITSNCGSGAAGGTIQVGTVTGGTPPLQYSVIQNSLANYPDNLSVYGAATTFNETAYGTYQVRVKDACNQLYTKTVQIVQSLPPVKLSMHFINDNPCNSPTWDAYFVLNDLSGNAVSSDPYFQAGGITIKEYQGAAGCTKGALLNTYSNLTTNSLQLTKSSSGLYYFEVTTACGLTTSFCSDYSSDTQPVVNLSSNTSGCNLPGSPLSMNIFATQQDFVHYPLTVTVTPVSGGAATNYTFANGSNISITNLPLNNYTVTVKDSCNNILTTQTINNPTTGPATTPAATVTSDDFACLNGRLPSQEGTERVGVTISGFIPDLSNPATVVKITSGPSNIGVAGTEIPAGSGIYYWQNMLPGSYVVSVVTSCTATNLNFTFAAAPSDLLSQHIKADAISYCGGNGSVEIDTALTDYNGRGNVSYTLMNATSDTAVAHNITGVFSNLPAGSYYINMDIYDYCGTPGITYSVPSNTVTVNAAGTPAQITKKQGVICEDASGTLLSTGSAYLEIAGAPPVILEYKPTTSSTWITFSSNAPQSVTITGLVPYTTYDVRATSCGNSSATQVAIGKLDPIHVNNTTNPCIGNPYVLSVPEMAGAAYTWKNPAGATVSTSYNYTIPAYNASYDGLYTCAVTFGSCVNRSVSVSLNATLCNQPLPVRFTSFNAVNNHCEAVLKWTANYHNSDAAFIPERSTDGKNFTGITTIAPNPANDQYSYTDLTDALAHNNLYYRVKLTDVEGNTYYSPTAMVNSCDLQAADANSFTITPNPASVGQSVTLTYNGTKMTGAYTIVNAAGQTMQQRRNITLDGSNGNKVSISLDGMKPGIYFIILNDDANHITGHQKLVVY